MTVASDALRKDGNLLLAKNSLTAAIRKYSEAVAIDPSDHLAFSNRSAARLLTRELDLALADANTCIELAPRWGKGYIRKFNALNAVGRVGESRDLCVESFEFLDPVEAEPLRVLLGQSDIEVLRLRLCGTWRGRVSSELGGYTQSLTFGPGNSLKVEVFGRSQNCTYSLDQSKQPVVLTILFGPDAAGTNVPYIIEFRDADDSLAMCCPFLVPEVPSDFSGPGFVIMKRSNETDGEDFDLLQRKMVVDSIADPQERMERYLNDFLAVLADPAKKLTQGHRDLPDDDDETRANKQVIHIMAAHVKISELEQIYGPALAKASFGIIAGGDDYHAASEAVQVSASRLRDLLVSSGFMTSEGLEQARLQYTRPMADPESNSYSKSRLQKKLMQKKSIPSNSTTPEKPVELCESSPCSTPEAEVLNTVSAIKNESMPPVSSHTSVLLLVGSLAVAASLVLALRRFSRE